MTTGPRSTPHPIVLHLDDNGTPVRFAESSSIFVSSVSALTISATTWLGLNSNPGLPAGGDGYVQISDGAGGLKAFDAFTYDDNDGTLFVTNINASVSGSFDSIKSDSISSTNIISDQVVSPTVSATLVSAVTVCATNYNNLFDALSFQNLDNRYLNSSGDSVTGSFFIGTVSASNISATTYLNLPSASAIWNASAIRGFPVSSTPPELGYSLVYNGNSWVPSSVAGLGGSPGGVADGVIQIKSGGIFSGVEDLRYNSSLSALQSNRVSATTVSAGSISVNTISATTYSNLQEDTARWNASKFQGTLFNKGSPAEHDLIGFKTTGAGGEYQNYTKSEVANFLYPLIQPQIPSGTATWNASAIRGVTVTSTAPTTDNVLRYTGSVWAPSSSISLNVITAVNLSGANIVGSNATVTAVSSTNLSAVNARITGLSATTISATNWQGLPPTNASAFGGLVSGFASPTFGDLLIVGFGDNTITNVTPAAAAPGLASVLTNGSTGYIQFRNSLGAFSGDVNLRYIPSLGELTTSAISLPSGTIYLAAPADSTYISNQGVNAKYIQVFGSLTSPEISATTYTLFGKATSSANTVTPPSNNNQNIVYDSTASKWKPGYAVYQATGTPAVGLGSNGDIYFQYLP